MPKILPEYEKSENLKNKFVIDEIPSDDEDLEALRELNKVKNEIRRKKVTLKQKTNKTKHENNRQFLRK